MTPEWVDKFRLDVAETTLVVVDIQERLAAVMDKRDRVVGNTLHLIEAAKLLRVPVIVTEQYPKGLGPTVEEVRSAVPEYKPIEKMTFSCCGDDAFNRAMFDLGRKRLVLAGMEAHVCVLQTCVGLLASGYIVHTVADAVCSRKKDDYKAGLGFMSQAGAVITCTETVLFQLLERAGTDAFRAITKRIK